LEIIFTLGWAALMTQDKPVYPAKVIESLAAFSLAGLHLQNQPPGEHKCFQPPKRRCHAQASSSWVVHFQSSHYSH
jgi:hypothetical protein